MTLTNMNSITMVVNIVESYMVKCIKWLIKAWKTVVAVFSKVFTAKATKEKYEQQKSDSIMTTNNCSKSTIRGIDNTRPNIQGMVDKVQKMGISSQGIRNKIMIEEIIRKVTNK